MPDAYTEATRQGDSQYQDQNRGLMAGVASAAVVSGELIIGLDDGRIIRAGWVQGPTGKTGPEGAMGSTGQRGKDGNTILSAMEKPKPDVGTEGDFYINTKDWYIYGPKTSGQWGSGTFMLAPKEYLKNTPSNQGGGGTAPSSDGGGGGTGTVFSNAVYLSGSGRSGRLIQAPGGNIIPEGKDLSVQSNLNKWIENSLRALDTKLPVKAVDDLPDSGDYDGDMVVHDGVLHVWIDGAWLEIAGGGGEPNLGKESKPWLQINRYGMRTSRTAWGQSFVYEVSWSCNPSCTYSWQHEIDINGDDNWIDVAAHPQKDELGFEQSSETPVSVVLVQGDQASKFPNALMRFRLAGELNGILSELSSGAIAAWEERTDEYNPPLYEDGTAVDLDPYATVDYVDEKVEGYLEKTGGEVTGRLDVTGPVFVSDTSSIFKRTDANAGSNYVLSVEAPLLDPDGAKDVAFRVTADGAVKAGHDTTLPFMAAAKNDVVTKAYADDHLLQSDKANDVTTSFRIKANGRNLISSANNELGLYNVKDPSSGNAEWAATKGYVDKEVEGLATEEYVNEQIAAIEIPDGGGDFGFTEEYNGNRYYKSGLDTTTLSDGEVMFLAGGVTTDVFAAVTHVGLPEAGIDWTKFTRIGTIEVRNGPTVCGHLQVISAKNNPGRNWLVKVKMLDIETNDLSPDSGHPCYFWGMFTK